MSDRQVYTFRVLCMAVLLGGAVCYVFSTIHWQWTWDTQVMHYIVLLLGRGKVPYKDIVDLNMPGSYLTERWAIDVFGGGDLGWRYYEFTLLGSMTLAMIVIALPYDWLAGLFAGVIFAVLHGNEGAGMAAERDEVMTVLLIAGYAFLFTALRRRWPVMMLPFGVAFGIAILIKPTVLPFALALLLLPFAVMRKEGRRAGPYVLLGLAGFAVALGILLAFLLPQHAFGAFFDTLRRLVPYYSRLAHPTWAAMVRESVPPAVVCLTPIAIVLAAASRQRANWETMAIWLGILFGAFTYFIQHKAYTYHRYTLLAFALLWIGIEFTTAMKDRGWRRDLGAVGMGIAVLVVLPLQANLLRHDRHPANPFADQLQADLIRLGGSRLDGHVQCLDVVTGCYSALYRLNLAQSTGFMGDLQFFTADDGNAVPYYRRMFWDEIHQDPPQVIALSSEWFGAEGYSFDKLNAWPQLRDYLDSAYDLAATRHCGTIVRDVLSYRIYVLKAGGALGSGTGRGLDAVPKAGCT